LTILSIVVAEDHWKCIGLHANDWSDKYCEITEGGYVRIPAKYLAPPEVEESSSSTPNSELAEVSTYYHPETGETLTGLEAEIAKVLNMDDSLRVEPHLFFNVELATGELVESTQEAYAASMEAAETSETPEEESLHCHWAGECCVNIQNPGCCTQEIYDAHDELTCTVIFTHPREGDFFTGIAPVIHNDCHSTHVQAHVTGVQITEYHKTNGPCEGH